MSGVKRGRHGILTLFDHTCDGLGRSGCRSHGIEKVRLEFVSLYRRGSHAIGFQEPGQALSVTNLRI
jgi:hypothetical protein